MKRTDCILTGIVLLVAVSIYYPVFRTGYFYTDEIVQLWKYRNEAGFHMFLPQGRNITDAIFKFLFSSIHSIYDIRLLRLFSFRAGW